MPTVASTTPPVLIAHLAAVTSPHPGRLGRGDAAQPRAAGGGRAVRAAGGAAPRPHRPRHRPGAGHRPAHRRRPAPLARQPRRRGLPPPPHRRHGPARRRPRAEEGLWDRFVATPLATSSPEILLLGSSDFSAQLAGILGLPFAFAHHFDMGGTLEAVEVYRSSFQPSPVLDEPHTIVSATVLAADTEERGRLAGRAQPAAPLRHAHRPPSAVARPGRRRRAPRHGGRAQHGHPHDHRYSRAGRGRPRGAGWRDRGRRADAVHAHVRPGRAARQPRGHRRRLGRQRRGRGRPGRSGQLPRTCRSRGAGGHGAVERADREPRRDRGPPDPGGRRSGAPHDRRVLDRRRDRAAHPTGRRGDRPRPGRRRRLPRRRAACWRWRARRAATPCTPATASSASRRASPGAAPRRASPSSARRPRSSTSSATRWRARRLARQRGRGRCWPAPTGRSPWPRPGRSRPRCRTGRA